MELDYRFQQDYCDDEEPVVSLEVPRLEGLTDLPAETNIFDTQPAFSEVDDTQEDKKFLERLLEFDSLDGHSEPYDDGSDLSTRSLKPTQNSSFISTINFLKDNKRFKSLSNPHQKTVYIVKTVTVPQSLHCESCNITTVSNKPVVSASVNNSPEIHKKYRERNNLTVTVPSIRRTPILHKTNPRNPQKEQKMNVYSNSPNYYNSSSVARMQEKEELQRLNDRFLNYVQKVRQIGDSDEIDSSVFLKSAKAFEDEITNLKNLYERELENVRNELDKAVAEKNKTQMQCSKSRESMVELEDRLAIASNKNKKLIEEMNLTQQRVGQLETELQQTRTSPTTISEMQQLQRDVDNILREDQDLKRKYEKEQIARQDADDKVHQLSQNLEFSNQVHVQQSKDLHTRLESTTATVLELESHIRDLHKTNTSVPDLFRQIQDASEMELDKYKMESEANYNRNIASLKTHMDSDSQTIAQLTEEKSEQQSRIIELQGSLCRMEAQMSLLDQQRKSSEDVLMDERAKSTEQLHVMEKKLKEVQDLLVVKIQEANIDRKSNIPLKTEIDAMKALLREEEKRLSVSAHQSLPVYTSLPVRQSVPVSSAMPRPTSATLAHVSVSTAPQTMLIKDSSLAFNPEPSVIQVTEDQNLRCHSASPIEMLQSPTVDVTKYTYEVTPSINKLQKDPYTRDTSRPVGPVARVMSAPVTAQGVVPLASMSLGQGQDYFDEMFQDLNRDTLYSQVRPKSSPVERPPSSVYHDYNLATSSAIGEIKILEVQQQGKYIRLHNDGKQDTEFGGYLLQQNVGGHPVAVYRFPPRTKFSGNGTLTVWSGSNDPLLHQPPTDFVWKEQQKWGTGPECTTILCKPNGQAIAWTTAAHRFTKNAFEETPVEYTSQRLDEPEDERDSLTEVGVNINELRQETVYLRREKQAPPTLLAQKHPHGISPGMEIHPTSSQARPHTYGNDNSSMNRQSRSQSTRPDPIPGQPYAGASGQRMGSASLKKYPKHSTTVRGNGFITNKSDEVRTSEPPCAFMTPHHRFEMGLEQVRSQHNLDFTPPMPRPPLFSIW